jgi:hypothetical protein
MSIINLDQMLPLTDGEPGEEPAQLTFRIVEANPWTFGPFGKLSTGHRQELATATMISKRYIIMSGSSRIHNISALRF